MGEIIKGKMLTAGSAGGRALVSGEPISFWGGYDPATGEIVDRRHELSGQNAAGRVFVFPHGRGSSTASAVLAESIKNGMAPAAIINSEIDPVLLVGAFVADVLYGRMIPVVVVSDEDLKKIAEGRRVCVGDDGTIELIN